MESRFNSISHKVGLCELFYIFMSEKKVSNLFASVTFAIQINVTPATTVILRVFQLINIKIDSVHTQL